MPPMPLLPATFENGGAALMQATLPVTLQEATALQAAHEFIDKLRTLDFFNTG